MMRKFFSSLVVMCVVTLVTCEVTAYGQDTVPPHATKAQKQQPKTNTPIATDAVPQYLQDIAVTIRSNSSEGSGAFKVTKDGQVWVWTCGHVIASNRSVRKLSNGKSVVEFSDLKIIKVLTEDGRKVGELTFDAEVIRYSDANHGEDLALLRLRSKAYKPAQSVQFYLDSNIPAIGARLLHCGSLLGEMGSASVTSGIISQHGRVLNGVVYDQTSAPSFPGSSGGIICLEKDGRYTGMLVRGAGETFSLYVPIRRMQTWAKRVGVDFAIDDNLPIPSLDTLRKQPIDGDDGALPTVATKSMLEVQRSTPTRERVLLRAMQPNSIDQRINELMDQLFPR